MNDWDTTLMTIIFFHGVWEWTSLQVDKMQGIADHICMSWELSMLGYIQYEQMLSNALRPQISHLVFSFDE